MWGPDKNHSDSIYSARGYAYRNCTDYVAWKLEQLGVDSRLTRGLGHGGQWYDRATSKPGLARGSEPRAGAAAVIPASTSDNQFGHVAYVESVNPDGTITVSEFNGAYDGNGRTRTGRASDMKFTQFVYFAEHMTNPPGGPNGSVQYTSTNPFPATPPNGAVVDNIDGGRQLYVAAGGSLFEIPREQVWEYLDQARRFYGSGQLGYDILPMLNGDIQARQANWPSSGSHPPADHTFLYERGSGDQFTMSYGKAFWLSGESEIDFMDGRGKAVMVPYGGIGPFRGVPDVPDDVILRDGLRPEQFHARGGQGWWIDNFAARDCILAQGGSMRHVPAEFIDILARNGRLHRDSVAHCSFPANWAMYGQGGGERWYVAGNNPYTRARYANPLAMNCHLGRNPISMQISVEGINTPQEVGQLACQEDRLVRDPADLHIYQYRQGVLHYVPSPEVLDCVTGGRGAAAVLDLDAGVLAEFPQGSWVECL